MNEQDYRIEVSPDMEGYAQRYAEIKINAKLQAPRIVVLPELPEGSWAVRDAPTSKVPTKASPSSYRPCDLEITIEFPRATVQGSTGSGSGGAGQAFKRTESEGDDVEYSTIKQASAEWNRQHSIASAQGLSWSAWARRALDSDGHMRALVGRVLADREAWSNALYIAECMGLERVDYDNDGAFLEAILSHEDNWLIGDLFKPMSRLRVNCES